MQQYASRTIETFSILNNDIDFITSNDRIVDRVTNSSYEEYILEKIVSLSGESKTFWDIGACLGIHSFIGALYYDSVVSFEPMPSNRGVLMENKMINSFENIHVVRDALSNSSGETEFAIRQSLDAGHGRHSFDTGEYEKVRTVTVEQSVGDSFTNISFPNVIKIDVEGAEGLVLEGLSETLSDSRCTDVILETHEPNPVQPSYEDYGYTESDIRALLKEKGFTVREMENYFHLYATKNP